MDDSGRLRRLAARHRERTYRAAYRVLAEREAALDATQDAFVALAERGAGVPDAQAGAWLARVATNVALDRLRRRARERRAAPRVAAGPAAAPPGPLGAAVAEEERGRVLAALGALPERQREVLALRAWEGRTFAAIARELGISEGATKVHFRRGLTALRHRLQERVAP